MEEKPIYITNILNLLKEYIEKYHGTRDTTQEMTLYNRLELYTKGIKLE